jgi:hypothetical protein
MIDLRKWYRQIPVNPANIPKLAVTMPMGLFEYVQMAFGLRNSGATFQKQMDWVIDEVKAAFTFADDSLMASKDHAAHKKDLRQFISCLQKHSLVIYLEKCVLGGQLGRLLGHHESAAAVRPLPSQVKAVQKFPQPIIVKDLRRSWTWLIFTRRFLPAIACTLRPAPRGGPKEAEVVEWSESTMMAFQQGSQIAVATAIFQNCSSFESWIAVENL